MRYFILIMVLFLLSDIEHRLTKMEKDIEGLKAHKNIQRALSQL